MSSHGATPKGSSNVIAKLPWRPKRPHANVKLESTEFYQHMLGNGSREGKLKAELYQLFNDIAPMFLPLSFYNMDCFGIYMDTNNGEYWAYASHFLYCSEAHGQVFFPSLVNYLDKKQMSEIKELKTAFQKPLRNLLLKDELQFSGSAGEFLLNPWVIMQLPFQHAILHQWVVAFYAETLKFQKEVSDLLIITYPSHLRSALKLLSKISSTLIHYADKCHEYLFSFLWRYPNAPFGSHIITTPMPEVLPMLKFILSEKSKFIIKALKRMAWTKETCKNSKMEPPITKEENKRIFQYNSIYHFLNWQKQPVNQMFNSLLESRIEYKSWCSLEKQKFQLELVGGVPGYFPEMMAVIEEKIIKTGRLSGVSKETIMRGVQNTKGYIFEVFRQFKFLRGICSEANIIDDDKCGLIFSIISLFADVRVTEAVDLMVQILYSEIRNSGWKGANQIFISPNNADGPEMTLEIIQNELSKAVQKDEKFSFTNILKKVKAVCCHPDRICFPDFELGPVHMAKYFQARIRNLVYKMIEQQYKEIQNRDARSYYHYPECLTVQLMLPCFVASFLDLWGEEKVHQGEKYRYMTFVHEIILCYERHPFKQEAVPILEGSNFINFISVMNIKVLEKATLLKRCFDEFFWKNNALSNFKLKCVEYLKRDNYQRPHDPRLIDLNDPKIVMYEFHWYSYVYYFQSRISECLMKLKWAAEERDEVFQSYVSSCWNIFPLKKGSMNDHIQTVISSWVKHLSLEEGDIFHHVDLNIVPRKIRQAADKLSPKQLLSLSIYLFFKEFNFKKLKTKQQVFPLEKSCLIYDAILSNKKWDLKLLMASSRNEREDFSLVSYQVAKNNICYESVMKRLTSKGIVLMRTPGEITFCPIKHCRWCGRADVADFRVCPECQSYPEYPDLNFFCSEECENLCLKNQHTEEHAQYLMKLIGLV